VERAICETGGEAIREEVDVSSENLALACIELGLTKYDRSGNMSVISAAASSSLLVTRRESVRTKNKPAPNCDANVKRRIGSFFAERKVLR
jgi:hypothetical protein